jgi:hypothetical protein
MIENNETRLMSYLDDLGLSSVVRKRVLEISEFYANSSARHGGGAHISQ